MADLSMVFDLLAKDRASAEVEKVGKSMDDTGKKAGGLGDNISDMFSVAKGAALGAGLAVGAAFFGAIDQQSANTKLTAQLGLNPADSAAAGKMAGDLYAQNYGDSLDQVNEAVSAVAANVTGINDPDFSKITSKALDLSSTFGVDLAGSTRAVANLMSTGLVQNSSQAFDVITAGFQQGNDRAGDWLDTLTEYAPQFQKLGLSGAAATNLISQGLAGGARDSDLVADALKEFSIRAVDGSQTTISGFQAIGLNAGQMAEKIGAGGDTAAGALNDVFTHLRAIKDPVAQAQAATALFGTQAEDLGKSLYALNPAAAASARATEGMTGASDRLDTTLGQGLGPRIEELKRGLQQAGTEGMSAIINGFTQGKTSAGGWQGTLQNIAATLSTTLQPALDGVSSFVTGTLAPALSWLFGFLSDHQQTVLIVAGVIAALLTPAIIAWGISSVVSGAQSAGAWVASTAQASWGAVSQAASAVATVASWVWMGVSAVAQGVWIAATWAAQTVVATVGVVAGWVAAGASVVAGWVVMGAQALARGAEIAAVWVAQTAATVGPLLLSWGIAAATVVAGWVLMGVQSLIQAARMAAAWILAMGPVGWIIAAVIGLVALIIANWENVKNWTVGAFTAIWDFLVGLWNNIWGFIKGVVSAIVDGIIWYYTSLWNGIQAIFTWIWNFLVGAWNGIRDTISGVVRGIVDAVSGGISNVINFFKDLPGKILDALAGFGKLLLNLGGDLLRGLWDGISGAVGWLMDKVGKFFGNLLPGWVKDMLGISSPSKVFAEFGRYSMEGFAAGITAGAGTAVDATTAAMGAVTGAASFGAGGGALGYTAPGYDLTGATGGAASGGATHTTIVSGVVGPQEVAAIVARDQRTTEFLAGV